MKGGPSGGERSPHEYCSGIEDSMSLPKSSIMDTAAAVFPVFDVAEIKWLQPFPEVRSYAPGEALGHAVAEHDFALAAG
jgi:hypothetical protein